MKNFAPHIYRQRLVVEGIFTEAPTEETLAVLIQTLSHVLGMTIIFGPIVKNLAGALNPKHAGLEAIAVWAESGVSVYVWEDGHFFTADIYTCKAFAIKDAISCLKQFFKSEQIDYKEV